MVSLVATHERSGASPNWTPFVVVPEFIQVLAADLLLSSLREPRRFLDQRRLFFDRSSVSC
jgi:hypothetical protein